MRLLFLNRSFYPDVEATGQLLTELCTDLAQRGYRVRVIAGQPNFQPASATGRPSVNQLQGVEILRVRNLRFTKNSLLGRALGLVSYLIPAFWKALWGPRPDVIIVETDPPFLGAVGAALKCWHRCRLIYYLQDLFPEVGLALGKLRPGLATWLLRWTTQLGLRHADRIVVLGQDMKERVLGRGIAAAKIEVISNWADTDTLHPNVKVNGFRHPLAELGRFVVMYSGNLGLSQNLETLLAAAAQMRDESVSFALVGEGAAKKQLQEQAKALGLRNVCFLTYQPKEALAESLSAADLHFIPLRRGLAGCIVPSKLYGVLAVGAPYVAAVDGDSEVARITNTARSGLVIEPDSVEELVRSLRWCLQNRPKLLEMGRRGREAAVAQFSRRACVGRFDSLLRKLVGQK